MGRKVWFGLFGVLAVFVPFGSSMASAAPPIAPVPATSAPPVASPLTAPIHLPDPVPRPGFHPTPQYDRSTVLVRFRAGASANALHAAAATVHGTVGAAVGSTGYSVVHLAGSAPKAALVQLRRDPSVQQVSLNYLRRIAATPNDPYYAGYQKSYLTAIRMPQAWDITKGSTSFKIAIIDTGVDLNHPDLVSRINPGFDFVHGDSAAWDDNGHGTMVAGIAAALTNNGKGVAGVAWTAGIIPVKVLDSTGVGTDANVAAGIDWAADHGASVINLSLGGYDNDPVLLDAVNYALGKNIPVVAAAGNDSTSDPFYPAAYPGVLAVAGTDTTQFTWWSNYGSWVNISAPNINITSTYQATGTAEGYATGSGTSFGSPIVAGVALLVKVKNPSWKPADIAKRIEQTAKDMGPKGYDQFYGFGQVDGDSALTGVVAPAGIVPKQDALEPNDTLARRTELTASASQTASISPEGDADFFSLATTASGTVTFTVTPPAYNPAKLRGREMAPTIDVYDMNFDLVASAASSAPGAVLSVTAAAPTAGIYIAAVRSSLGSQSPGNYSVVATTSPYPVAPAFGSPTPYLQGAALPTAVQAVDLDGDGLTDVVATTKGTDASFGPGLLVYLQQGDGTLAAPTFYATATDADSLAVADFDQDGQLDVAVALEAPAAGSASVALYYDRAGVLTPETSFDVDGSPVALATADNDGDGRPDLFVSTATGVAVWSNPTTGFVQTSTADTTVASPPFGLGDVGGDGLQDVAYAPGDASVSIDEQQTDGTFLAGSVTAAHAVTAVAIADVTGDGRPDLVALESGSPGGNGVEVFPQLSTGDLGPGDFSASSFAPSAVQAGDLDGDGTTDVLVTGSAAGGQAEVFLQGSNGALGPASDLTVGVDAGATSSVLAIADVTGDHRADVVAEDDVSSSAGGFDVSPQLAPTPLESAWIRNESPPDFSIGQSTTGNVTIEFARDLDPASLVTSAVRLRLGTKWSSVTSTLTYDQLTKTVTVDPTPTLAKTTPYVVVVTALKDVDGKVFPGTYSFRFTTGSS